MSFTRPLKQTTMHEIIQGLEEKDILIHDRNLNEYIVDDLYVSNGQLIIQLRGVKLNGVPG
jgi:hypothetical protein